MDNNSEEKGGSFYLQSKVRGLRGRTQTTEIRSTFQFLADFAGFIFYTCDYFLCMMKTYIFSLNFLVYVICT